MEQCPPSLPPTGETHCKFTVPASVAHHPEIANEIFGEKRSLFDGKINPSTYFFFQDNPGIVPQWRKKAVSPDGRRL